MGAGLGILPGMVSSQVQDSSPAWNMLCILHPTGMFNWYDVGPTNFSIMYGPSRLAANFLEGVSVLRL
jgi:hypothetical protein